MMSGRERRLGEVVTSYVNFWCCAERKQHGYYIQKRHAGGRSCWAACKEEDGICSSYLMLHTSTISCKIIIHLLPKDQTSAKIPHHVT
jgi:hypothetical protein